MQIVSDILLSAGALGAAVYCMVLSRRLRSFSRLEDGMGGAVATLSVQVDDMTRVLGEARLAAGESSRRLADLTDRAAGASRQLELLLASLHDLPGDAATAPPAPPARTAEPRGRRMVRRRTRSHASAQVSHG